MASASNLFRKVFSPELYKNYFRNEYNTWSTFDSLGMLLAGYFVMKGFELREKSKSIERETEMLREHGIRMYGDSYLANRLGQEED